MAFTDTQIKWLETAQGKAEDFEKSAEATAQKAAVLTDILTKLDADKQGIKEAQDFKVSMARHAGVFKLPGKGKMDWLNGKMMSEVDSYADLPDATGVTPEVMKAASESLAKILDRQHEMQDSGLFSDEDIARELWAPLVREGIIPSNIVPDAYSEFKKMFDGASEIYDAKLDEYSDTASKFEDVFRVMGIAKDTITMASTIAASSMTFADFDITGRSRADGRELEAKNAVLGAKQNALIDETRTKLELPDDAGTLTVLAKAKENPELASVVTEFNDIDAARAALSAEQFSDPRWVAGKQLLRVAATSLATTSLTVAEKGVRFAEKPEKDVGKTLHFASDAANDVLSGVVTAALSAAATADRSQNEDGGNTHDHRQGFSAGQGALAALINGNKLADKILLAAQAKTPEAREKAVMSILSSLGDTLAEAAAATNQVGGEVNSGLADSDLTKHRDESIGSHEVDKEFDERPYLSGVISESIRAFFIMTANVGGACKELAKPNPDFKLLAGHLTAGLAHIGASSATVNGEMALYPEKALLSDSETEDLQDKSIEELLQQRLDVSGSAFQLSPGEAGFAPFSYASYFADVNSSIKSMVEALNENHAKPGANEAIARKTKEATEKLEAEKTGKELDALKAKLADKGSREEFLASIEEEADAEFQHLKDVIAAANPPADPQDKAAVEKSMRAVDALIADIKASEMKIKLIETIAVGGTKVLTRLFPVTGLADSLRQLSVDAVALLRKGDELNTWRKNAALASASGSVYEAAVKERLENSSVQLSQKSFNAFFSVLGVVSQGTRLGDVTGAATGIAAGTSMAKALTDYGYKMYDQAKILRGWKLYVDARNNPGNRKAARTAIAWNSTLAKCVLAYGIAIIGDPVAAQVGRNCGLTPEILASDKDVCLKVVKYFETLYSEDPVVLRSVPKVSDWHPGTPDLTLTSWLKFKRAAATKAYPRLSKESCLTPDIDTPMKALHSLCKSDPFKFEEIIDTLPEQEKPQFAKDVQKHLQDLHGGLSAYRPKTSKPEKPKDQRWEEGARHYAMEDVADALKAQVSLILREVNIHAGQPETEAA